MPDSTSIGNVIDSVEINIENNVDTIYGFSYQSANGRARKLSIRFRFTVKYLDDDQTDRLFGSSTALTSQTPVDVSIKFTKPAGEYVDFVFTNVVISRIGENHSLNEWLVEDVENLAQRLTVTEVVTV